jgi:hypothetical protein
LYILIGIEAQAPIRRDFPSVTTKKLPARDQNLQIISKKNDNPFITRKFYGFIFQIEPSETTIQTPKLNPIRIFAFSASLLREKAWVLNANILLRLTFTKLNIKVQKMVYNPFF